MLARRFHRLEGKIGGIFPYQGKDSPGMKPPYTLGEKTIPVKIAGFHSRGSGVGAIVLGNRGKHPFAYPGEVDPVVQGAFGIRGELAFTGGVEPDDIGSIDPGFLELGLNIASNAVID